MSDQEAVSGLRVLATAILDENGHPIAAISVATPAFGTPVVEFVERAAGPVTEAARSIADAMRAHGTWSVQLSGQGG